MNIKASGLAFNYTPSPFDGVTVSVGSKVNVKKETVEVSLCKSSEEAYAKKQVEQIQEENDPQAKKIERILNKFRSGNELSEDELAYLAKHAPDAYKEVYEVLQEREQLERELEMAESKLEAMQVYSNALTQVSATTGTGDQANQQAEKNMTRINHLSTAFGEFTGTLAYRELEDEEDKAEKIRKAVFEDEYTAEDLIEELTEVPIEESEVVQEDSAADLDKSLLDAEHEASKKKKKKPAQPTDFAVQVYNQYETSIRTGATQSASLIDVGL